MSKIALVFIATFLYGIYAAFSLGPAYGFYLYELVYFLNPTDRWWGGQIPNISYSFYIVLLIMVTFFLKKDLETNTLKEMPEFKWFVLVLLCYGVVTFIAVNATQHNRFLEHLLKAYVVMYFAYRVLSSEKKLELALLAYTLGAAYIGYEAMNTGRDAFGRVEGIGMVDAQDSNVIAASIAPAAPLLVYFGWHGSVKIKLLAGLCAALVLNGLILINSRGAFLGTVAGIGYFFSVMLLSKYKLPKQRLMVLLMVIVSIIGIVRLVDDAFIDRMLTLQDQTEIHDTGSGSRRINYWLATFDLLKDHPFGAGIRGFETLSSKYLSEIFMRDRTKRAVHSMWFQGLSEIGWLGFGAFIMLLLSLRRHMKTSKIILINNSMYQQYYLLVAIEGALLTFLVAGTFIDVFRAQVLFWLLLFGICASVITHRNHKRNSDLQNTDS